MTTAATITTVALATTQTPAAVSPTGVAATTPDFATKADRDASRVLHREHAACGTDDGDGDGAADGGDMAAMPIFEPTMAPP